MRARRTDGGSRLCQRLIVRRGPMQTVVAAIALMLVFEGLLPFFSPSSWRSVVRRIGSLADGQIRFFGMASILVGVALLLLFFD